MRLTTATWPSTSGPRATVRRASTSRRPRKSRPVPSPRGPRGGPRNTESVPALPGARPKKRPGGEVTTVPSFAR